MVLRELKKRIAGGENRQVEFKEARTALPADFFDTVSAFLNTDGGTIILGVTDRGRVVGVAPDAVSRIRTDIANLSNNPQKLDPHHFGLITPENVTTFPKNPTICKFMLQLGRFDELGSGVINVNKYLPLYANGAKPEFRETDLNFVTLLPLAVSRVLRKEDAMESTAQVTAQVIAFCREARSAKEIMARLGLRHWKTFQKNYLIPLLEAGVLERTIPDKPKSRLQKYRLTNE